MPGEVKSDMRKVEGGQGLAQAVPQQGGVTTPGRVKKTLGGKD